MDARKERKSETKRLSDQYDGRILPRKKEADKEKERKEKDKEKEKVIKSETKLKPRRKERPKFPSLFSPSSSLLASSLPSPSSSAHISSTLPFPIDISYQGRFTEQQVQILQAFFLTVTTTPSAAQLDDLHKNVIHFPPLSLSLPF